MGGSAGGGYTRTNEGGCEGSEKQRRQNSTHESPPVSSAHIVVPGHQFEGSLEHTPRRTRYPCQAPETDTDRKLTSSLLSVCTSIFQPQVNQIFIPFFTRSERPPSAKVGLTGATRSLVDGGAENWSSLMKL